MYERINHIMNKAEHFKSGFVAVVGRPNVGKSTMINALIGDKIAIVSDKAQTTRNRIICVYTDEEKQIVFMDTPGVHKPKHKLGEFMVDAAIESLKETEAVLFVVAGNEKRGPGDNFIIEQSTDIKDKNGKMIHVGDIVKMKFPYDKRFIGRFVVIKDPNSPRIGLLDETKTDEIFNLYNHMSNYYEVIGNINE